ncbi:CopG family transcriptional regulator [Frankia sp. CiP3]|uniref:ribbon-helix-helix domain-containing protein n=1 Tax=Frankia sp. CiP3 TaxID=2880971 RepID=UPI001EF46168|nr:CopG family transcriptional regulator [Frankia sp. CiP3]
MARTTSTPLYLGDDLRARAENAARTAGISLSAWVRDAIAERLERQAVIADGLAAAQEWEAEHGPLPQNVLDEAQRELEDAGILPRRIA